jgi:hypothetical protein
MSIKRMLLLASMALAAVAFAAPSTAGAVVQLREGATPLAVGTGVTATSSNLITTTPNGTLECAKVTLHYSVATNGASHVVLNPVVVPPLTHNATAENCVLNTGPGGKFTTHITNSGTGPLTINTWGTGEADATFTSNITPPVNLHCTFKGKVFVQWSHVVNSDNVTVETTSKLTGEPAPPCPNGEMHGELTIERSTGQALNLNFVKTT